jgi:hypothetical protein
MIEKQRRKERLLSTVVHWRSSKKNTLLAFSMISVVMRFMSDVQLDEIFAFQLSLT